MKPISGKRRCQLLEARGWIRRRVHGSHHVYAKSGSILRISVPVHRNAPLKRGLQRYLMKLADIEESDL
ncbi:MAG: type II toxin-antitoxin system HicA family toxin [Alphaproteobacteria bacterium]|nr:type II toxin-antitoxin system HicA family toxin [Alphaproteobacteria bacterium]